MKTKGLLLIIMAGIFFLLSCNPDKKKNNSDSESTLVSDSTSIDQLSKEIRNDPKNADLFKKRSELYASEGNLNEAINDLNISLKLDSLDRNVYYTLIDLHMKLGQSGKAKEAAEKCLKIYPGDKESLLRLAQIYYYVQDYTQALEYIRLIKSYNQQDADTYFVEALIYRETNQPVRAIKSLQTVLEYDADHIAAYNMLGQLMMQAGDPLALEYFKAGLMKAPDNLELLYNLGFYYQENAVPDSALNQYSKILGITDSLHYGALYNSAYLQLVYKENYAEAVDLFTHAIAIDSLAHKAYYNRGYAYELMGNFPMARSDYHKALEIVPNYPLAIQGLNSLDNK